MELKTILAIVLCLVVVGAQRFCMCGERINKK